MERTCCASDCGRGTLADVQSGDLPLEDLTVGSLKASLGAAESDTLCLGGRRLPGDPEAKLGELDVVLQPTTEVYVCPAFTYGEQLLCCPDAELKQKPAPKLGLERFLTFWILLAAAVGTGLGQIPHIEVVFETLKLGNTNLLTAVGMILMILPPFASVRYNELPEKVRKIPRRISIGSVVANWLVGPFMMLFLGMATLFNYPDLLEGLVYIGAARCIAMVLVWTAIADGDSFLCVSLVILNSLITVVLYAPIVTFLGLVASSAGIKITSNVSFLMVLMNVAIYLGIPLVLGVSMWCVGHSRPAYWSVFLPRFAPVGLLSLLWTVLMMFMEMSKPLFGGQVAIVDVLLVIIPLMLYFTIMFSSSWVAGRYLLRISYSQTVTFAFTAASNNFELALAACTAIFGTSSRQAVSAVMGPLIEIPVMLSLVKVAKFLRYETPKGSKDSDEVGSSSSSTEESESSSG